MATNRRHPAASASAGPGEGGDDRGDQLEIGAGSAAMAAELLAAYPDVRMTVTDYDEAMVAAAGRLLAPAGERVTLRRL